ncbi:hypothetical protein [Mesorhizobium sp. M8A.F.Ca.ET.208.01.1.1]|uniref:hypothetical protein n=1 Tax=Mesorhizobium sp. M8A.F.Ca.ET.208.01.1.1 TaxID=2563969 RepID=UPI001AEDC41F|nr:hypothetical protein [Mesorhizobium sp. M8A.F.Ca.ET.208.01.1.1]
MTAEALRTAGRHSPASCHRMRFWMRDGVKMAERGHHQLLRAPTHILKTIGGAK